MINEQLLKACMAMQRTAQRQVYEYLSPKLYHTCKRYLKLEPEIEDALADIFYIIFTKLSQLKEPAAFEGWARKIAVNQCLAVIRKKVSFNVSLDDLRQEPEHLNVHMEDLEEKDLLQLLGYLPEGCRTVFNLFAIEGYSHKEIAEMLQISEGTSKSQLNFSRTKLKVLVNELYYTKTK